MADPHNLSAEALVRKVLSDEHADQAAHRQLLPELPGAGDAHATLTRDLGRLLADRPEDPVPCVLRIGRPSANACW